MQSVPSLCNPQIWHSLAVSAHLHPHLVLIPPPRKTTRTSDSWIWQDKHPSGEAASSCPQIDLSSKGAITPVLLPLFLTPALMGWGTPHQSISITATCDQCSWHGYDQPEMLPIFGQWEPLAITAPCALGSDFHWCRVKHFLPALYALCQKYHHL